MAKQLKILRGIPGSGKSHFAKELSRYLEEDQVVICSTDDYFMDRNNNYLWNIDKLPEAHRECFRKFKKAVDEEVPLIIIDNTNITASEYSPYAMYGDCFGYEVTLITIWITFENAAYRQAHDVPLQKLLDMYRQLINEQIPPWLGYMKMADA